MERGKITSGELPSNAKGRQMVASMGKSLNFVCSLSKLCDDLFYLETQIVKDMTQFMGIMGWYIDQRPKKRKTKFHAKLLSKRRSLT
jgi:transcriptional antiterminator